MLAKSFQQQQPTNNNKSVRREKSSNKFLSENGRYGEKDVCKNWSVSSESRRYWCTMDGCLDWKTEATKWRRTKKEKESEKLPKLNKWNKIRWRSCFSLAYPTKHEFISVLKVHFFALFPRKFLLVLSFPFNALHIHTHSQRALLSYYLFLLLYLRISLSFSRSSSCRSSFQPQGPTICTQREKLVHFTYINILQFFFFSWFSDTHQKKVFSSLSFFFFRFMYNNIT